MPKLSDTQAVLLAAAAARSDRSVLPAPATLRLKGAALAQTLKALRGRGLIAEAPIEGRAKRSKWAGPDADAGERNRLIVTPAGLAAIGVEKAQADAPRREAAKTPRLPPAPKARKHGRVGRVASWGCCSMRSRVRRGRPSTS